MPSPTKKSPQKRLVNRLAAHGGFVESKIKRKRKLNATDKYDASPVKQQQLEQQQLRQQQHHLHHHRQKQRQKQLRHIRQQNAQRNKQQRRKQQQQRQLSRHKIPSSTRIKALQSTRTTTTTTTTKASIIARTSLTSKLKSSSKSSKSSSITSPPSPSSTTSSLSTLSSASYKDKRYSGSSSSTTTTTTTTKRPTSTSPPSPSKQSSADAKRPNEELIDEDANSRKLSRFHFFKCRYCGKTIKRKDNLKRHELVAHQDRVIHSRCRICGATFRSSYSKNSHVKQVHGIAAATAPTSSFAAAAATTAAPATAAAAATTNEKNKSQKKRLKNLGEKAQNKKNPQGKRRSANVEPVKRKPSIDAVMEELVGDMGEKEENALFVERVRSKWFESPEKNGASPVDGQPPPSNGQQPSSALAKCHLASSPSSSPGKHSKRELIQKIIMSKNKQAMKLPIFKDQSLGSHVQTS